MRRWEREDEGGIPVERLTDINLKSLIGSPAGELALLAPSTSLDTTSSASATTSAPPGHPSSALDLHNHEIRRRPAPARAKEQQQVALRRVACQALSVHKRWPAIIAHTPEARHRRRERKLATEGMVGRKRMLSADVPVWCAWRDLDRVGAVGGRRERRLHEIRHDEVVFA